MPDDLSSVESEEDLSETIGGILGAVVRRRWVIILCIIGITMATIGFAMRLPNSYSSEATLLVVQPGISQRYVSSDTGVTIADTANALKQEVLSRSRLKPIIAEFGLYPGQRQRLTPDELADEMRKGIEMEPLDLIPSRGEFTSFKIAFVGDNPQLVQEVTSRLASLFIEENLKTRGDQAGSTSTFLTERLEEAKQKITEQEQRLKDFKMRNLGELPEQQSTNLASLTEMRIQLQTISTGLAKAQEERKLISSSINDILIRLQSERSALMNRFTARHPMVIEKDREIAKIQSLIESLKGGKFATDSTGEPDDESTVKLKRQVEENVSEIQSLSRDEKRVASEMARYEARLNLTPVREQELSALVRDYEVSKSNYTDLLKQQQQSALTTKVEERQEGQHFRILEPPTVPTRPSGPHRLKISLGGMAAGALLGLVLTFLLEKRNQSFRTEKAVSRRFALPLVIALPVLQTPDEIRSRKWMMAFEWLGGSFALLILCAVELYVLSHN